TLEAIGGRGVVTRGPAEGARPASARPREAVTGELVASSYRSVWTAPEVAASPALAFLHPDQHVQLSPEDAARLALRDGVWADVADESCAVVRARVAVRDAVPAGRVILQS